jgi:hypothetical protein
MGAARPAELVGAAKRTIAAARLWLVGDVQTIPYGPVRANTWLVMIILR